MPQVKDPFLPELLIQLRKILNFTYMWGQRRDLPAECEAARQRAILLNHRRYLRLTPAYRQLADSQNISEEADVTALVNTLAFPADVFKSYKRAWLEARDFASMTSWLRTVYTSEIRTDSTGIDSIAAWIRRLQMEEIFVTCSSGTSGRLSFVPRDRLTFQWMRTTGTYYHHPVWKRDTNGRYPEFDCLVLGSRGTDTGIQGAGTGIAAMAKRSHFLLEADITADFVFAMSRGERDGLNAPADSFARSLEFLQECIAAERRVLIFGAPFQVKAFCERAAAQFGQLRLPSGSILVSGGGWKAFTGYSISRSDLQNLIEDALAISRDRVIDTYSSAELNCVFMSCTAGRYHIPPLIEPVVLDEALTGVPGREGSGILAFLDPFALSYPGFLITGDYGHLSSESCECGLKGWSIAGEIRRAANQEIKGCGAVMASVSA